MFRAKFVIPAIAFVIGLGLLVAWASQWFGDWGTFVVGALLLGSGAFGLLDMIEES
jgi:hypothetical protein